MKHSTFAEPMMTKDDVAAMVLAAKKKTGMSWTEIAAAAGMSPVFVHSAAMGMSSMPEEAARKLVAALGLPDDAVAVLMEFPTKTWDMAVPTDPCIYRLYEIVAVYGPTMKAIIQEEFGDGIMSAIDFDMQISRVENPKGDRVKVEMTGKFLKYNSW